MKKRPHKVDDAEIVVRRAMENELPDFAECKKVFLCAPGGRTTKSEGLGLEISDDDLREYFGQFGEVNSVKQVYKEEGKVHKGVGFIEYEDPDSVDRVVLMCVHLIKERSIEARKGLSEEQMRMQKMKEQERMERLMMERQGGMMRDMCPNPMMEMMGNMMFNTMGGFGNNGFGDFNDQQGSGQDRNGRGHGRGSFGNGREGFGGFADMDAGFGTSGMSDYTSDYNDGPHPAANMPGTSYTCYLCINNNI